MWKRTLAEKGVSPEAIGLLEECFDSDPAGRPADATVLLQLLEQLPESGGKDKKLPEDDPPTPGIRRKETLKVLAEHRIIQEGSEIEIVPEARPPDADKQDEKVFRARIANVSGRPSVEWLYDNNVYSLTNLTAKLWQEHGVQYLDAKMATNWRIVGHTENIWEEAEHFRPSAD
jgi:hypothetical protein